MSVNLTVPASTFSDAELAVGITELEDRVAAIRSLPAPQTRGRLEELKQEQRRREYLIRQASFIAARS